MLRLRQTSPKFDTDHGWIFGSNRGGPLAVDTLDKLHARTRRAIQANSDFVLHSLRHTMLTRLGEAGADAFTIMRVAGHSTVVVSQRYVHPSEESVERAFERLEALNGRNGQTSTLKLSVPATNSTTLLPAKAASRH